jgi:hypothetical protein
MKTLANTSNQERLHIKHIHHKTELHAMND